MSEQFANQATSTLSASISAEASTLAVKSASKFPSEGNFRIVVGGEIMLVTEVASKTFTVSRGQEGTSAAAHASGDTVSHVLTAASLATKEDTSNKDTDSLFSANSDTKYPSQKAARAFVAGAVASLGRRLLRVLAEGTQDASIVVIGDSTSGSYSSWVGKVLDGLAARYPAYTVKYRDWTDGNSDYNAAVTKQTGSGERTLTLYNCAVASMNAQYQMAPYFDTMIASKQPDLIFFSHGHNHGGSFYTPEPYWRDALTIVTQSILRACPLSEIVLIAQNPRTDANAGVHALRQFATEQVAQLCGFGFVNAHRLFLDVDPTAASLLADGIHPNATGYTLLANEILRLLTPTGSLGSQQHSSFLAPVVTNGLLNGDFASFASPPTLTNWTAVNALLAKDTTNFESANGYSVRMTTVTPGTACYMSQNLSGNAVKRFAGEWATLLARVRVPVGQTGYPGKVNLTENNGSHAGTTQSDNLTNGSGVGYGQGAFRWAMCTRRIAANCTNLSSVITCEQTVAGDVSVDRVILVPGIWPKDIRA